MNVKITHPDPSKSSIRAIAKLDAALAKCKLRFTKVTSFELPYLTLDKNSDMIVVEHETSDEFKQIYKSALSKHCFVLYLSKYDEVTEILGLRFGAQDVLHSEQSTRVISERLTAIAHRNFSDIKESSLVLSISISRQSIMINGNEIGLTISEMQILKTLSSDPGAVCSLEALASSVHEVCPQSNNKSVSGHIKRIRQKCLKYCGDHNLIESVYRGGYRLSPSVNVNRNISQRREYSNI